MAEMIGFEACFGLRWNWNGILLGSSLNLKTGWLLVSPSVWWGPRSLVCVAVGAVMGAELLPFLPDWAHPFSVPS